MVPFDDRDGFIWLDGRFVDWREAKLHVLTHSLHYSGAVFEGVRAYNGKVFKMTEHNQRLRYSAHVVGYEIPYSVEELDRATLECLEKNNLQDAYIRPVAWRGAEQMGLGAQSNTIHVAIAVWAWPNYFPPEMLKNGLQLMTSKWRRPAPDTAPCHSKAAGLYQICTMSKHDAEEYGFNDALMLDYRGRVAEATGANIFLVKDGALITPDPDCFLNGITRQTVIDLAKQKGMSVQETAIMPEDLADAQEIFLTGTAYEVIPVGRIDDYRFEVGPVTKELRSAYHKLVGATPDGT